MIAHRLNTVRKADQIIMLDEGHIVQRGTHAELMQQDGLYRRFVGIREEAIGWKIDRREAWNIKDFYSRYGGYSMYCQIPSLVGTVITPQSPVNLLFTTPFFLQHRSLYMSFANDASYLVDNKIIVLAEHPRPKWASVFILGCKFVNKLASSWNYSLQSRHGMSSI